MAVNLSDIDSRDENVSTLPEWHPTFKDYRTEAQELLDGFRTFNRKYQQHLAAVCPNEPLEELKEHMLFEVVMYLSKGMDSIVEESWGNRTTEEPSILEMIDPTGVLSS